ncbi:hypothetical protein [Polyangium sp. 15x6]|uniref:hypothetical protein n=1 Tax=Polyangium sp. 15x6 TaxID=3042687 RepID=UPI00249CF375|nr:hypothetical protein [Polyangium sp. 15x6]MDI3291946.1 hypothetical protein [Polyangium sp. 15x6]
MHPASSANVVDAVALIGACEGSTAFVELAAALAIAGKGLTGLPLEAQGSAVGMRIHRSLGDPAWNAAALAALADPALNAHSRRFVQASLLRVPSDAPEPFSDELWLWMIRAEYRRNAVLRWLADVVLGGLALPERVEASEPAPVHAPAPAPEACPSDAWNVPIALLWIGHALDSSEWLILGAGTLGLAGYWNGERRPVIEWSAAAWSLLGTLRGFKLGKALLADRGLMAAARALVRRCATIAGGEPTLDTVKAVLASDPSAIVAACVVMMAAHRVSADFTVREQRPQMAAATATPSATPSPETPTPPSPEATSPAPPSPEPRRRLPCGRSRALPASRARHTWAPLPRGRSPPSAGSIRFVVHASTATTALFAMTALPGTTAPGVMMTTAPHAANCLGPACRTTIARVASFGPPRRPVPNRGTASPSHSRPTPALPARTGAPH